MERAGRKPLGPGLVQNLEGSAQAKERLRVILETIAGHLTIGQACEQLRIKEAMFHRLRTRVLEAGLSRLEPQPRGRPSKNDRLSPEAQRVWELEQTVQDLDLELKTTEVKLEIAQILPGLIDSPAIKKTNQDNSKRHPRKHKTGSAQRR